MSERTRAFEAEVRGWMHDEGSIPAPDRLVETVMDDVRRVGSPRRSGAQGSVLRWPWLRGLRAYAGLSAAIAVGVALGFGLVSALGVFPRVGVPVSPTPSAAATSGPPGSTRPLAPNGSFAIPATGLVAVGSELWVARADAPRLDAIDPASMVVRRSVPLDAVAVDLIQGEGFIWASEPSGRVVRVDPATAAVTARIDAAGTELAAGDGAVWVGGIQHVARIDPASATISGTFATTAYAAPHGILAAFGSVWLGGNQVISQLDASTGAIVRAIPGDASAFAATADRVWARRGTELLAIDLTTGSVAGIFEGIPSGALLSTDGVAIWAAGLTLARVDPAIGVVAAGDLAGGGEPALAVATGFDAVWVAVDPADGGIRQLLRFAARP